MNPRVILIDDEEDAIEVLTEFLSIYDIDVLGTANNGKDGFELYAKLNPDIVICDIMMPDYDGFYAIDNIRKQNSQAEIIVTTADMTAQTAKKLEEKKLKNIAYKPFELPDLVNSIKSIKQELPK